MVNAVERFGVFPTLSKLGLLPAGCTSKSLTGAPKSKFYFTELFVAEMWSVVSKCCCIFFKLKKQRGCCFHLVSL